jgi:hypothetical protein
MGSRRRRDASLVSRDRTVNVEDVVDGVCAASTLVYFPVRRRVRFPPCCTRNFASAYLFGILTSTALSPPNIPLQALPLYQHKRPQPPLPSASISYPTTNWSPRSKYVNRVRGTNGTRSHSWRVPPTFAARATLSGGEALCTTGTMAHTRAERTPHMRTEWVKAPAKQVCVVVHHSVLYGAPNNEFVTRLRI